MSYKKLFQFRSRIQQNAKRYLRSVRRIESRLKKLVIRKKNASIRWKRRSRILRLWSEPLTMIMPKQSVTLTYSKCHSRSMKKSATSRRCIHKTTLAIPRITQLWAGANDQTRQLVLFDETFIWTKTKQPSTVRTYCNFLFSLTFPEVYYLLVFSIGTC